MHTSTRRQLALRLFGANPAPAALPTTLPTAPPPTADQLLLARATFGADQEMRQRIDVVGVDGWLDEQLHPDAIADHTAEGIVAAAAATTAPYESGAADLRMLLRAVYSRRQLAWRMTHFLNNHFSTYEARTRPISEVNETETFRSLCFEPFWKVLRASASSPAMIDYLDAGSNIAGNPNENYARELLELHTISIDGGYSEADVAEVARVFTGWQRENVIGIPPNTATDSRFVFNPNVHDSGPKALSLGWSTPGFSGPQGRHEGMDLLRFLADHSRTATFFCTKLCRYFVGDAFPTALFTRVRATFQQSGGSLRETVRALFQDPDFHSAAAANPKAHDGFEFAVGIMRRLRKFGVDATAITDRIAALRSLPHRYAVPTGYPEIGPAWHGPNQLLPRWQFADDVAHDRVPGTEIRWDQLFPNPTANAPVIVARLAELLFDRPLPPATIWVLERHLHERLKAIAAHPPWSEVQPHAVDTLSLMLQLPEAQMH